MNAEPYIPNVHLVSFDGATAWFSVQINGLMFHSDDDPAELHRLDD